MVSKRLRGFPADMMIMVIITELFAIGFSCAEITGISTERIIERRTAAVAETSVSYLYDPTD